MYDIYCVTAYQCTVFAKHMQFLAYRIKFNCNSVCGLISVELDALQKKGKRNDKTRKIIYSCYPVIYKYPIYVLSKVIQKYSSLYNLIMSKLLLP